MEKGTKMRINLLAVLAVAFVLALGGTAVAQTSPTQDAYGGVLGNEQDEGDVAGDVATQTAQNGGNGSLPFTGSETILVALAGIGLVGLGFAMRRGTRRQTD
jgi:LPXTG-motif cell wall-anchored protein